MKTSDLPHPTENPLRTLHILSGVALILATLLLFSGCRSMSPLDVAAKTLTSTVATVDVAMQSYASLVALDVIKVQDQRQVKKLYEDYQAAESVAEVSLLTAIRTGDASSLANFNAALRAAQTPLLTFLARFSTSPP